MSKKDKKAASGEEKIAPTEATQTPEAPAEATVETAPTPQELTDALESAAKATEALKDKEDQFLRLAAEYDNFRRRSQKEKDGVWADAKADTVLSFLSVYDNLERALKAPCADEAYAKGVEMTMAGLREVLSKLGVEEIPAQDQTFDPNLHNAVMHTEDPEAGENTIVEVFQTGFKMGEKVIRFAMVKVAN